MVISAQLRAARAYLGWTMARAAQAAGIHRRTVIRLETDSDYVARRPASLRRLVAAYAGQRIVFPGTGLAIADAEPGERPPHGVTAVPPASAGAGRAMAVAGREAGGGDRQ